MKKQMILFSIAIAILTSCNNEAESTSTNPANGRVPLKVNSGIQTRAYNQMWEAGDAIGIFMLNGSNIDANNKKYTLTANGANGAFTPAADDQTIYFPVDGTLRDFVAYYPYTSSVDANNLCSVNVTTQTSQPAIDLMSATKVTGKSKNDPSVAFTFKHQLVKLDITIKADKLSLIDSDLAGVIAKITNQQTRGTFNVVTGSAVSVMTGTPADIALKMNQLKAEGIILPNANTEGMKLTFTVPSLGNQVFEWTIKEATNSQKFEAGKKYKYTITIARVGVTVTSTIEDWAAGNGADGESGTAN